MPCSITFAHGFQIVSSQVHKAVTKLVIKAEVKKYPSCTFLTKTLIFLENSTIFRLTPWAKYSLMQHFSSVFTMILELLNFALFLLGIFLQKDLFYNWYERNYILFPKKVCPELCCCPFVDRLYLEQKLSQISKQSDGDWLLSPLTTLLFPIYVMSDNLLTRGCLFKMSSTDSKCCSFCCAIWTN